MMVSWVFPWVDIVFLLQKNSNCGLDYAAQTALHDRCSSRLQIPACKLITIAKVDAHDNGKLGKWLGQSGIEATGSTLF